MADQNPSFVNQMASSATQSGKAGKTSYLLARVTHVVRGPYIEGTYIQDTYYKNPTDIGKITYQLINTTQNSSKQSAGNPLAKQIYSSLKQYPLEGEFVLLLQGPSTAMNTSRDSAQYFYLPPFNLWNASHQNALPDLEEYGKFVNSTITKTYNQSLIAKQPSNLSATSSFVYPLSPGFLEKSNIKSLEQFTGDVTLEGRWGNSIRLGSTTFEPSVNYWSSTGSVGNPITIIRNGQGKQKDEIAWIPTVENINRDPSSVYLTEGQKIVIDDINNNFSLASLGVNLERTTTVSIPIQQQLTSTDTISPAEQDRRISDSNK